MYHYVLFLLGVLGNIDLLNLVWQAEDELALAPKPR
jgi:hypothetical protein